MTQLGNRTKPNSQIALEELRKLIFSGELPAGSDHLESELADKLGMSRTPIREAAVTLESQGLVEVRPRKGLRVLPVSPDDMREIYEVLTELESLAARLVAERSPSDEELTDLAQSIDAMESALEKRDLEAWALADEQFHLELTRLSGNSRILTIVSMLNDQVRRARLVTLHMRPFPVKSNEDHRRVFEDIRKGDSEAAWRGHRDHRREAGAMIVELLEKHRLTKV